MKKSTTTWIFVTTILVVLLATMTILGFTGFLFSLSSSKFDTDLVVGQDLNISVKPNETSVKTISFDGAYLPNEKLPQKIYINAEKLTQDVFVRVKGNVSNIEGILSFETTEKFVFEEDGYYYYDGTIIGGDRVCFCDYVVMPDDLRVKSDKKGIFTIIIECLDSNEDINKIWKNV